MRYVSPSFLESTLQRGKPLEQFLGALVQGSDRCIRWAELRPVATVIEVWSFVAPDDGDLEHLDIYELIGVEDGVLEATAACPAEAFAYAAQHLGTHPDRWTNQAMSQDEYRDFILAGRPATWPSVGV